MNENLTIAAMTAALADPAGAPSHPLIFLILGVVTFALHIAAVSVLLGSTGLALVARFKGTDHWLRLGATMSFTAKAAVGAAIVLGVAPLLFVQVVFDPFWYASSMLSAVWTLVFLLLLVIGYLALYRVDALLHRGSETGRGAAFWLAGALVLFIACGALMHVFSNQALFPGQWLAWYAPDGRVDASGRGLHYVLVPRLLFFLSLSLPVTAAWLYGLRRYVLSKQFMTNDDALYSDFLESTAFAMGRAGGLLTLFFGVVWMAMLPAEQAWFIGSAWPWIGLIAALFFLAMPYIQKRRRLCTTCSYMAFVMSVVMTVLLATVREALRVGTLMDSAGFSPFELAVNWDVPSMAIFFVTFLLVGGTSLAYIFMSAWKAGLATNGKPGAVWTPSAGIERAGSWAALLLSLWIAGYFAVGLAVVLNS